MLKYMKCLLNKIKEYEIKADRYNKYAKNPFLDNPKATNPFMENKVSFYDRTYIWVE